MKTNYMIKLNVLKELFPKAVETVEYYETYHILLETVKEYTLNAALFKVEGYINSYLRKNDVIKVIAGYDLYKYLKGMIKYD